MLTKTINDYSASTLHSNERAPTNTGAYHPASTQLNPSDAWKILDSEDQWLNFSQKRTQDSTQNLVQSQFLFDGLRCAACSGIIEQGLLALPGVVSARISLSKKRGVVLWSSTLTRPSLILKKVQALGYSASPALHQAQEKHLNREKRAAFWRWMVAGFCMMQVMMYSTPSYFSHLGEISADARGLLNWASWLLSLPVLLFSSSPFFSNAYRDLSHRQISMDLPVALGILITFILSSAATFNPTGNWGHTVYFDSLTMLVFFLLSARLIEANLHSKTMGALETLISRIPENTEKQNTDGTFSRVLNQQLKIGDIARVHIGEAFPADGKILTGVTLVDESLLTGESTPIQKALNDSIIMGSYNLEQTVTIAIERLDESTQYNQIVQLINQAALEKPKLTQLIDRIAKPFLVFVLISAGLAAALLWQIDPAKALITAATVLIVTCPCALSLAMPAAMLASASAFVKAGILIKNLQAIENIAAIDTIIFDKTGTLTHNQISVTNIQCKAGLSAKLALHLAAILAEHSRHPVARAIFSAQQATIKASIVTAVESSDTMHLSNIKEIAGAGMIGELNQPSTSNTINIAQGTIKFGSAIFCATKVTEPLKQAVYLADNDGWLATFELQEQLKWQAIETIETLKQSNFAIAVLSGDQYHTVSEIAKKLGLADFQAACSPQDKLNRLQTLKTLGKKVLMVGDGLNDGPILSSADVSIAMGKGVPLVHAHADYILLNDDISQIPSLILHAKKTMQIIKQNISWAIVYNCVCIPLAFFGVISAWVAGLGMALSSLIVVFNALRLTRFATLATNMIKST